VTHSTEQRDARLVVKGFTFTLHVYMFNFYISLKVETPGLVIIH